MDGSNVAQRNRFRKDLLPPARVFYENALGKLSKPSRGWARGNCPFHDSKSKTSFSVNLDSGGFFCHGCQASGGDIVSFVQKRDGLSFRDACEALGCWDGALRVDMIVVRKAEAERERMEQERQAEKDREHQERIRARDWLHCCDCIYRESSARLTELRQGDEAEIHWSILALVTDEIREAETAYLQKADLL
jgi:hypothetical protein